MMCTVLQVVEPNVGFGARAGINTSNRALNVVIIYIKMQRFIFWGEMKRTRVGRVALQLAGFSFSDSTYGCV